VRTRRLIVQAPEGERELLFVGRLTVGRAPECDISVADTKISRRHAEFDATGPMPRVSDLGSRNGLLVNGRKVAGADLSTGDVVTIGDLRIRFEEVLPTVAPPRAPITADRTAVLPIPTAPPPPASRMAPQVGAPAARQAPEPVDAALRRLRPTTAPRCYRAPRSLSHGAHGPPSRRRPTTGQRSSHGPRSLRAHPSRMHRQRPPAATALAPRTWPRPRLTRRRMRPPPPASRRHRIRNGRRRRHRPGPGRHPSVCRRRCPWRSPTLAKRLLRGRRFRRRRPRPQRRQQRQPCRRLRPRLRLWPGGRASRGAVSSFSSVWPWVVLASCWGPCR
jgi:pSer/pThr/pTyr-binding forkhead associated (FHA) protein